MLRFVLSEPFPLPPFGMGLMELGGSHTAPWLPHTDSFRPCSTLYTPSATPCVPIGPCSLLLGPPCTWGGSWGRSRWDPCAGHVTHGLVGGVLQWGASSAPEQAGAGTSGATASPEGWWRHETEAVIPRQVGTAGLETCQ